MPSNLEELSESQEVSPMLSFSAKQCAEEKVPVDGLPAAPPSLLKQERRRKYQKSGRPHDWRTRKDPFEGLWEEITAWLEAKPELTAADIFRKTRASVSRTVSANPGENIAARSPEDSCASSAHF